MQFPTKKQKQMQITGIAYPDGLAPEDMREWCERRSLPVPDYVTAAIWAESQFINYAKTIFEQDPILSYFHKLEAGKVIPVAGGKSIAENIVFYPKYLTVNIAFHKEDLVVHNPVTSTGNKKE